MLEKLKFWKKDEPFGLTPSEDFKFGEEPDFGAKDELGLPKTPGDTLNIESDINKGTNNINFGKPKIDEPVSPSFEQPSPTPYKEINQPIQQGMNPDLLTKDLQIIMSKLDTLKAQLDSMNQRIANIEKKAFEEETKARTW